MKENNAANVENNPISLYNIDDILQHPEEWKNGEKPFIGDGQTVISLSNEIANHIFSMCAHEPKAISSKGDIISLYAENAIDSLENKTDNALLPEGVIDLVDKMDKKDADSLFSTVMRIADGFSSFTPISSIKVIATKTTLYAPIDNHDVLLYVPIVTESTSGVTAIIPFYRKESTLIPSALTQYYTPVGEIDIHSIILWDIFRGKVIKPTGNSPKDIIP